MLDTTDAKQIAVLIAAVAEPTRMKVVHLLLDGPSHVGRLAELAGVPMVNMSHHLGVMRTAGLLTDAKDGRRVVYQFNPEVYEAGGPNGAAATIYCGAFTMYIAGPDGGPKKKKAAK